jgi:hypothetical protein
LRGPFLIKTLALRRFGDAINRFDEPLLAFRPHRRVALPLNHSEAHPFKFCLFIVVQQREVRDVAHGVRFRPSPGTAYF